MGCRFSGGNHEISQMVLDFQMHPRVGTVCHSAMHEARSLARHSMKMVLSVHRPHDRHWQVDGRVQAARNVIQVTARIFELATCWKWSPVAPLSLISRLPVVRRRSGQAQTKTAAIGSPPRSRSDSAFLEITARRRQRLAREMRLQIQVELDPALSTPLMKFAHDLPPNVAHTCVVGRGKEKFLEERIAGGGRVRGCI